MWQLLKNHRVWQGAAVVAVLLAIALWPTATAVDIGHVARGPLVVTIDEDGETRLHHRFIISAPLAGRLERIALEPGDDVKKEETVVARLQPVVSPPLDARSQAEAAAAVEAARGVEGRARAEEQRARAALTLAESDLSRERDLFESGLTTRQALEARQNAVVVAEESVRAAEYATAAAASDLVRARARLQPVTLQTSGRVLSVRSPVDGVVLRRFRQSEAVVAAGEPLVEIGDPSHVEVVADLLSTDAVRVKAGMRVMVEQWGGDVSLGARVRRVEPAAFTKVSALGVEEQRVNVIMDFDDGAAAWAAMGDAYRVEARIVVWEADAVLAVPTSALFRTGDQWAAYVVENGRVRRVLLQLGQRTNRLAEVREGLTEGQAVVLHPPDILEDGSRVNVQNEGD